MAKLCSECGHKLRVVDKYCAECGVSLGDVVGAVAAPRTRVAEYCEITWGARGFLLHDKSFFCAQDMVTGAEIQRSAMTFVAHEVTRTVASPTDDTGTRAVADEMVDDLLAAGWVPLQTRGPGWWSQRFSRTVGSQASN